MADEARTNRLGRGLSALLGSDVAPVPSRVEPRGGARTLPVADLRPSPQQPRRRFDDASIDDLAVSIRSKGVLQPLLVRPAPSGEPGFEIIAGERRWRAAQRAGVHDVPVIVRDLTDREVLEVALIENVQRADLNAVEEAKGYRTLIEQYKYTQDELSRIVGKSRSHIANALRLLSLPESVIARIDDGSLSAGHARTLVGHPDAEALAERMVSEALSVRGAEDLMRDAPTRGSARAGAAAREKDADTEALEREIADLLGLKIRIADKGGRGELKIAYRSLEQLEDVCARLRRPA